MKVRNIYSNQLCFEFLEFIDITTNIDAYNAGFSVWFNEQRV